MGIINTCMEKINMIVYYSYIYAFLYNNSFRVHFKMLWGGKDINESCLGLLYSVFHKKGIHITQ